MKFWKSKDYKGYPTPLLICPITTVPGIAKPKVVMLTGYVRL
jgi:hypothetical protein